MVTGEGTAFSGVDCDNLAAASADQEDPVETISEDLEELHVWKRRVKGTRGSKYNIYCVHVFPGEVTREGILGNTSDTVAALFEVLEVLAKRAKQ